jgi:hypothetical protein
VRGVLGTDHALKDDGTAAPILTLKGGTLDTLDAGAARVQNVRVGPDADGKLQEKRASRADSDAA